MTIQPRRIETKNGTILTLRSPTAKDSERVLEHLRTTQKESYRNLNQSFEFWTSMSIEAEERILASIESAPTKFMIVATNGDHIVGGIGVMGQEQEFVRKNARIGMSIRAAYGGMGLGTQLVQYAIENAKLAGFHRLELNVRTYNQPGIALYEKFGFSRIGTAHEVAFVDGAFVDEYLYEMILKP